MEEPSQNNELTATKPLNLRNLDSREEGNEGKSIDDSNLNDVVRTLNPKSPLNMQPVVDHLNDPMFEAADKRPSIISAPIP